MSRPGFVLDVDERTPPLLVHQGEGFRLERLPLGTKVIYPPDSLPGIRNVDAAIRHALLNPHGTEPLPELLRPGMRLTIVFDDDGPGIPVGAREDVFKPFFRLDEARNLDKSGTGLGLAIARDIARSHGGNVTLGDSPQGGLRATIRIPA